MRAPYIVSWLDWVELPAACWSINLMSIAPEYSTSSMGPLIRLVQIIDIHVPEPYKKSSVSRLGCWRIPDGDWLRMSRGHWTPFWGHLVRKHDPMTPFTHWNYYYYWYYYYIYINFFGQKVQHNDKQTKHTILNRSIKKHARAYFFPVCFRKQQYIFWP